MCNTPGPILREHLIALLDGSLFILLCHAQSVLIGIKAEHEIALYRIGFISEKRAGDIRMFSGKLLYDDFALLVETVFERLPIKNHEILSFWFRARVKRRFRLCYRQIEPTTPSSATIPS